MVFMCGPLDLVIRANLLEVQTEPFLGIYIQRGGNPIAFFGLLHPIIAVAATITSCLSLARTPLDWGLLS